MSSDLEFRLLGPLEASVGGRLVRLPGGKPRLLLANLLLERNRPIAGDRLIDALWGEQLPSSARGALQVYVAQLRKALNLEAGLIVTSAGGYLIALERDQLDLDRFERLTEEGRRLLEAGQPERAAAHLDAALALWRGPALADLSYESSLQSAIHRLEELRVLALELRIEADLALGRHARLVPELEELVEANPFREGLRIHLVLALYRSARQADALAACREARIVLDEELGLEPSPALRRLEQAILIQDPALELAPAVRVEIPTFPERSLLLAAQEREPPRVLFEIARALATRPPRELILIRPAKAESHLGEVSGWLERQRSALLAAGLPVRVASFVSEDPGRDLTRLAVRLDVELLLVDERVERLPDGHLTGALVQLAEEAPCDLGVLFAHGETLSDGAVLVPFGGGGHEWAAVEAGARLARAQERPLRLAGAASRRGRRDASRLLADVSLALQRVIGIPVEPVLIRSGPYGLLAAAESAAVVVSGFPDDWRGRGLGETRLSILRESPAPVLLVRGGVRPGALAPRESVTRYTWTLGPAASR